MRPDTSRALTSRFGPCPSFLHCPGLHDVADANLSNCSTRSSLPTSRVSLVTWWRALLDELQPPHLRIERMSAPSHALTSRLDPAQAVATAPAFILPATSFARRALVVTLDVTRELGIFLPRASVADLTSSPPHFLMWKWARTLKKCTCEIRFFFSRTDTFCLSLCPNSLVTACHIASSRDLPTCSNVTTLLLLSAPCSLR